MAIVRRLLDRLFRNMISSVVIPEGMAVVVADPKYASSIPPSTVLGS